MKKYINRYQFLSRATFDPKVSKIIFASETHVFTKKTSKITLDAGIVKIGGSHPGALELPSLNKTVIFMEEGAELLIHGNLFIASGTTIIIKKNARLIFHGNNFLGHNNLLIAHKHFEVGKNTSTSWNVTLMESDGHDLYHHTGERLKLKPSPMVLGANVGIQMNATIPKGVRVGENTLIGPGTLLRQNLEAQQMIYTTPILKSKVGISAGLQFQK